MVKQLLQVTKSTVGEKRCEIFIKIFEIHVFKCPNSLLYYLARKTREKKEKKKGKKRKESRT